MTGTDKLTNYSKLSNDNIILQLLLIIRAFSKVCFRVCSRLAFSKHFLFLSFVCSHLIRLSSNTSMLLPSITKTLSVCR